MVLQNKCKCIHLENRFQKAGQGCKSQKEGLSLVELTGYLLCRENLEETLQGQLGAGTHGTHEQKRQQVPRPVISASFQRVFAMQDTVGLAGDAAMGDLPRPFYGAGLAHGVWEGQPRPRDLLFKDNSGKMVHWESHECCGCHSPWWLPQPRTTQCHLTVPEGPDSAGPEKDMFIWLSCEPGPCWGL